MHCPRPLYNNLVTLAVIDDKDLLAKLLVSKNLHWFTEPIIYISSNSNSDLPIIKNLKNKLNDDNLMLYKAANQPYNNN